MIQGIHTVNKISLRPFTGLDGHEFWKSSVYPISLGSQQDSSKILLCTFNILQHFKYLMLVTCLDFPQ